MRGDLRHFVGIDELLASWVLFTPILDHWKAHREPSFPNYPAGSPGVALQQTVLQP